ncbi:hypothetical protein NQ315_004182 [Exocentrus adspersus]|uniref:Fatty acyl-CoA reductase n=1 Tax=Exocentrus adspersus TaxID=1586481 RepID=A0AAV8W7B9_9CUCU|nr:hypothetical protein NQ315_004182 [Exocentrus adspersus]
MEKLLRSCDGTEKIYVLLRAKKGKNPEERLKEIVENSLFNQLRSINPEAVKKLIPICGDVSELRLGLSEEDTQTLIENIDIVYHAAASVRFDDHLKNSLLLNTRGTREVVELALGAKKRVTFVHVSTSYCNCDRKYVEEKLYPPHADWRHSLAIAEQLDEHTLDVLSEKYIHPLPNTYTFAKSLSEHVVNDLCKGRLLATIIRPSVVIPTFNDPKAGWVDNFNGPMGLLSAGGKGILKISYGSYDTTLDFVPVDVVVKTILIATRETTVSNDLNHVEVYNIAAGKENTISNRQLIELGGDLTWDVPFTQLLWYPSFSMTNNSYRYYITFLLYHLLPALLLDGLLKLIGKKPMLVKIQRKVYIANMALIYFMRNSFVFANDKAKDLSNRLIHSEKQTFSFLNCFDLTLQEIYCFYMKGKVECSNILFKENYNRETGFRNTLILWVMDYLLHIGIFSTIGWLLIAKIGILTYITDAINNYILYVEGL